uniref:Solute carrier organic anion transporter family member n=1 Tax=Strigamia maritima TaxID=126957 RepID=T1JNZ4_STRMM
MPDRTADSTNKMLDKFPAKPAHDSVANGMASLELSVKRTSTGSSDLAKLESPAASSWSGFGADGMDNASQTALATKEDDDDQGGTCEWGFCRPKFLQRFRSARWVLFWLCWAGALQGMVVNGFVNVIITTIERRFDLRSTETGLIAGAYDIASFLFLIPVSYFGGKGRKSRWLGFGLLIICIGSFVFSLPHFTTGTYNIDFEGEDNLCHPSDVFANGTLVADECSSHDKQSLNYYKHIFFLGQFLHGVGAAPLYTIGVAFIDESVTTKMSSVYLGTYYGMAVIGPAIGYLLGSQLLKIYTDVGFKDPRALGLNPSSNVWVGAWWIGFLLTGVLAFLVAIPILGFPKRLPGSRKIKAEKISEAHKGIEDDRYGSSAATQLGFKTKVSDLPKSLKLLLTNPCFMLLSLAGACEAHLLNGFAAFIPKYIETQFSVAASLSSLLVGVVTVPAGGGGTFLGGYLVKYFNLRCAGIIKMCVLFTCIAVALCLIFLINCAQMPFAGINTHYNNYENLSIPNVVAPCSNNCGCSVDQYVPVCGIDNTLYYSPCFAGCQQTYQQADQTWYSNCTCILGNPINVTIDNIVTPVMATGNMCETQCTLLPAFLGVLFIMMVFTFLTSMPALSATLRCVPDNQRSLGLGIQWLIIRLLGSIPSPIVFGALMDSTCILWHSTCEGEFGNCRVYNNTDMSKILLTVALIGKGVSLVSFACAWLVYKAPPDIVDNVKIEGHFSLTLKGPGDISVISREDLDYSYCDNKVVKV